MHLVRFLSLRIISLWLFLVHYFSWDFGSFPSYCTLQAQTIWEITFLGLWCRFQAVITEQGQGQFRPVGTYRRLEQRNVSSLQLQAFRVIITRDLLCYHSWQTVQARPTCSWISSSVVSQWLAATVLLYVSKYTLLFIFPCSVCLHEIFYFMGWEVPVLSFGHLLDLFVVFTQC